jgi:Domain of unknown function (DUF4037)
VATRWRLALAERVGASYASDENAQVVMVAGSVGRGSADRYSDIEVDVYYADPPSEAARMGAVERCGGTVELLARDEDEWEEQMSIGGFHAHTSTFLVATVERYLREVVDECAVAPEAQTRLFSLQHGITLKGDDRVEQWRAKAAAYPDGLQRAMLEENLRFRRFGYAAEMLAARDDLLALYEIFVETGRRLLGALLGLNRIYLPAPDYLKSMDETIGLMAIKPVDMSAGLKQSFRIEPTSAVGALEGLIEEMLELVETHLPGFDTARYRVDFATRRTPPTRRRRDHRAGRSPRGAREVFVTQVTRRAGRERDVIVWLRTWVTGRFRQGLPCAPVLCAPAGLACRSPRLQIPPEMPRPANPKVHRSR